MGGNAFDDISRMSTSRLKELYVKLLPAILRVIGANTENKLRVSIPYFYPEKVEHGDLDLMVNTDVPENFAENLIKELPPGFPTIDAHSKNDKTVSLRVRWDAGTWHQVDVEFVGTMSLREFEFCVMWHSYGGLGNILGTMIRWQGLKLRPRGLSFDLKRNHVFGGRDYKRIETFYTDHSWDAVLMMLGLTEDIYRNREALYGQISRCRGFGKYMYSRAGTNQKAWNRDKRRPIYVDFCASIADRELPEYPELKVDLPALLEDQGLYTDIMGTAASVLLSGTLHRRLAIPPPTPEEYAVFGEMKKMLRTEISPLELLISPERRIADRVRQLTPNRPVYNQL